MEDYVDDTLETAKTEYFMELDDAFLSESECSETVLDIDCC